MTALPYGAPAATGRIKLVAEDFEVDEELGFEPGGGGEHLWLRVEKRGIDTPELIRRIAREQGLKPGRIGYSGLKDRRALTRQWLSLHLPGAAREHRVADGEGYRILAAAWNRRKLRIGTHRGNRFRLRVRELAGFDARARTQLERIRQSGFANFFGRQRFGRRGDNVEQALATLGREAPESRSTGRRRRGLLLSSLRGFLFNEILSRRVAADHWDAPLDGDAFVLDGSRSVFRAPLDATIRKRFAALDIHPAGSLYGPDREPLGGAAEIAEQRVYADYPDITARLAAAGAKAQWRALRAVAQDLEYRHDEAARMLELEVRLAAGCYLTSLLDHFIVAADEGGEPAAGEPAAVEPAAGEPA